MCCRLGGSTFVMHELNPLNDAPAQHHAIRPDGGLELLDDGPRALAAVDHAVDEHAAPMRRDQRVGDRPAVEVAEREAEVLARGRRVDERDRVLLQREVGARDLARVLEQRAVPDLVGGGRAGAVRGEREHHGQRAASGDPRDRRPRDHGSPPGVGTELRPYAQGL